MPNSSPIPMRLSLLVLFFASIAAPLFGKEHVQFTTDENRAFFVRLSAIQMVEKKADRIQIFTGNQVISIKPKPNFHGLAEDLDTINVAYFSLLALVDGEDIAVDQKQFLEWLDLVRNKEQMKVIRENAAIRVTTYEARIECVSVATEATKER